MIQNQWAGTNGLQVRYDNQEDIVVYSVEFTKNHPLYATPLRPNPQLGSLLSVIAPSEGSRRQKGAQKRKEIVFQQHSTKPHTLIGTRKKLREPN